MSHRETREMREARRARESAEAELRRFAERGVAIDSFIEQLEEAFSRRAEREADK